MKKILSFVLLTTICVILVLGALGELSLFDSIHDIFTRDDSKVASTVISSNMLSFYDKETLSIETNGTSVTVTGVLPSGKYMLFAFTDNEKSLSQKTVSAKAGEPFTISMPIPKTKNNEIELSIYTNDTAYGNFKSWIAAYLYLIHTEDGWALKPSPVYEHNKEKYESEKSVSKALRRTSNIESNEQYIIDLAKKITKNCTTDYERIVAIHDYICESVYYDIDMAATMQVSNYTALETLQNQTAICSGFANSFAALCRSLNIPCMVVTGYALGEGVSETEWNDENISVEKANHAWNEAYVDGRWIIVDTTWDCGNKIIDGSKSMEREKYHVYFDANLQFFSTNHKILAYRDI